MVVADELLPSVTARLDLGGVRALVSEHGGRFAHASILARSQGTPAVVGIAGAARAIKTGDRVIVDGIAGVVFVNPPRAVEREYERLEIDIRTDKDKLRDLIDLPAVTADGTAIGLFANVSKLADTEAAMLYKADGIGLYRTEFGYAIRSALPTEEEQFEFLERAAQRLHPRRITFRLLDIGGDKQLSYFPLPASRNPSLAERGIRLLLKHPDVLKRQLRAFLRVSANHPISILLPVVGGLEEIRRTRQIIGEVQRELAAEGQAFDPKIPIGAMIEIPAAALIARQLAAGGRLLQPGNERSGPVRARPPTARMRPSPRTTSRSIRRCCASSARSRTWPGRPGGRSPSAATSPAIRSTPSCCWGSACARSASPPERSWP